MNLGLVLGSKAAGEMSSDYWVMMLFPVRDIVEMKR
jgi:hypothetical protein